MHGKNNGIVLTFDLVAFDLIDNDLVNSITVLGKQIWLLEQKYDVLK